MQDLKKSKKADSFYLTCESGSELTILGCLCVLEYNPDSILLKLRGRKLLVTGKNLFLFGYDKDEIVIKGEITGAKWG